MAVGNRYIVSKAMMGIRKADYVLRNADRMGDEAFEKWLEELSNGFLDGVEVIDDYFLNLSIKRNS